MSNSVSALNAVSITAAIRQGLETLLHIHKAECVKHPYIGTICKVKWKGEWHHGRIVVYDYRPHKFLCFLSQIHLAVWADWGPNSTDICLLNDGFVIHQGQPSLHYICSPCARKLLASSYFDGEYGEELAYVEELVSDHSSISATPTGKFVPCTELIVFSPDLPKHQGVICEQNRVNCIRTMVSEERVKYIESQRSRTNCSGTSSIASATLSQPFSFGQNQPRLARIILNPSTSTNVFRSAIPTVRTNVVEKLESSNTEDSSTHRVTHSVQDPPHLRENFVTKDATGFSKTPVYVRQGCPLPGWTKEVIVRMQGDGVTSPGTPYPQYVPPEGGRKLYDSFDVRSYLQEHDMPTDLLGAFDFHPVFCLCHRVEDDFYIECVAGIAGCGGWFHPGCAGWEKKELRAEEKKYEGVVCPLCTRYLEKDSEAEKQFISKLVKKCAAAKGPLYSTTEVALQSILNGKYLRLVNVGQYYVTSIAIDGCHTSKSTTDVRNAKVRREPPLYFHGLGRDAQTFSQPHREWGIVGSSRARSYKKRIKAKIGNDSGRSRIASSTDPLSSVQDTASSPESMRTLSHPGESFQSIVSLPSLQEINSDPALIKEPSEDRLLLSKGEIPLASTSMMSQANKGSSSNESAVTGLPATVSTIQPQWQPTSHRLVAPCVGDSTCARISGNVPLKLKLRMPQKDRTGQLSSCADARIHEEGTETVEQEINHMDNSRMVNDDGADDIPIVGSTLARIEDMTPSSSNEIVSEDYTARAGDPSYAGAGVPVLADDITVNAKLYIEDQKYNVVGGADQQQSSESSNGNSTVTSTSTDNVIPWSTTACNAPRKDEKCVRIASWEERKWVRVSIVGGWKILKADARKNRRANLSKGANPGKLITGLINSAKVKETHSSTVDNKAPSFAFLPFLDGGVGRVTILPGEMQSLQKYRDSHCSFCFDPLRGTMTSGGLDERKEVNCAISGASGAGEKRSRTDSSSDAVTATADVDEAISLTVGVLDCLLHKHCATIMQDGYLQAIINALCEYNVINVRGAFQYDSRYTVSCDLCGGTGGIIYTFDILPESNSKVPPPDQTLKCWMGHPLCMMWLARSGMLCTSKVVQEYIPTLLESSTENTENPSIPQLKIATMSSAFDRRYGKYRCSLCGRHVGLTSKCADPTCVVLAHHLCVYMAQENDRWFVSTDSSLFYCPYHAPNLPA